MEEAAIENRAKVSLFSFFKSHVVPYFNLSRVYQHNTTHFFLLDYIWTFRKVVASASNTEVCNALGIKDSFLLCLIIETAIAFRH